MQSMTEDQVRDLAGKILNLQNSEIALAGVWQITTFKQLWFESINKPDWRYLPKNKRDVTLILETKASKFSFTQGHRDELLRNCQIVSSQYDKVIGILYNGFEVKVFKNGEEVNTASDLQSKEYYFKLFLENKIDKQKIYTITKRINDSLHFEFGIKNLYHRMIFTACALVAARYGTFLAKGMNYATFHTSILSGLSKSLEDHTTQNRKLNLLLEVYAEIRMNITDNQQAIDNFIDSVLEISDLVNSEFWNGEDVMWIFFNEFNRYKKKSESGQVFTPDHITSLMYRLIEVNQHDVVLDAACGSGAFLVKAMANMIKESGGNNTEKAKNIKQKQLFWVEFDREIYALACANMLIHKDGKTNLEQLDTRTEEVAKWIASKSITKVLMNPPFENKYGCIPIVKNVLDHVKIGTKCAFILPDKKLEKTSASLMKRILAQHTLQKIIKLPEKTFDAGVTTSIFIFEAGLPQNEKDIFACYIQDDGLERVKNQGRQDVKEKRPEIEDMRVEIIKKQSGSETIQWIKPELTSLSYQLPKKEFEIYEEDFVKTVMDYYLFEQGIDAKTFEDNLLKKVLYSSEIERSDWKITISLDNNKKKDE